MNREYTYNQAKLELRSFITNDIKKYSKLRNFDFGIRNRSNVSNLSKYVSHRIIDEYEIIREVLKNYSYAEVEKFVQEVFWRIYWKGWMEHRSQVWDDFINSEPLITDEKIYLAALSGRTNIKCFNEWVFELKEHNYLHNHTRMWFASIWIFTLNLPWELGAKFFMENLYDGDAAVNTLSWRWVAGIQTKGKHYLAKAWNINKFSGERFSLCSLNENAPPKEESKTYFIEGVNPDLFTNSKHKILIVFESDLSFNNRESFFKKYDQIFLVCLTNDERKIKLADEVLGFKQYLMSQFCGKLDNCRIINVVELKRILQSTKGVDVIYPFIGENLTYLKTLVAKNNGILRFISRMQDLHCWKYSKKGFFNFKKNIPNIIDDLKLGKHDYNTGHQYPLM